MVKSVIEMGLARSQKFTELIGAGGDAAELTVRLSKAGGSLAIRGVREAVRQAPSVVTVSARVALRKAGLAEPAIQSPEQRFRHRLNAFQDSMALRIPEYELEHMARKAWEPEQYKAERKLGIVQDTVFDDARKWMEIAREEEHPHPSAGTDEVDRIHDIAACLVAWGLSRDATGELVDDLYEYFEIAAPRLRPVADDFTLHPWHTE